MHFPSSAHRLQPTQATFSPPTTHPLPAFQSWPHSTLTFHRWAQSWCGRALSIQRTCVSRTTARVSEDQRWSRGTQGWGWGVYVPEDGNIKTPYLSWQSKTETGATAANEGTDMQAVLLSVVTAAWLFICVPPSEKEAAPIGSRCERKDRQQPD